MKNSLHQPPPQLGSSYLLLNNQLNALPRKEVCLMVYAPLYPDWDQLFYQITKINGGATSYSAKGSWLDHFGHLHHDRIGVIKSYSDLTNFNNNFERLTELITLFGKSSNQQCMAFSVSTNNPLFFMDL